MKKYVIPIASSDVDLNRINFQEPLQCTINDNKINITYKKYIDPNTHKTVKNKKGINFKGEIVKVEDAINLVGNFHYSKKLKILWFVLLIFIELCVFHFALSDFLKTWFLDAGILLTLFLYNSVINGYDTEKFTIINLLTKETNKISSKKFEYTYLDNEEIDCDDLDELYKDASDILKLGNRSEYIKVICSLLGALLFFTGFIGALIFGLGSETKQFEIVNEYSPLYDKEDFLVDEKGRMYVVCDNYTEIFDENGDFLMKVNHGAGVIGVYLNFEDGLTAFLIESKNKDYEDPDYYHEFVVDISNEKIVEENTYREEQIEIENLNGSRYYLQDDKLYTIRGDKVTIEGDDIDRVVDLNSPKTPIYFGYFFTLSCIGVAMVYFINLKF